MYVDCNRENLFHCSLFRDFVCVWRRGRVEESEVDSDNTGQQISKNFFICDEYVINLYVCIYEVRNGTLKNTWL